MIGFLDLKMSHHFFEGGDLVIFPQRLLAFMGYGFRTSQKAHGDLEQFLEFDVIKLELIAFAVRDAFSPRSWRRIQNHPEISRVFEVDKDEALKFALNWVEVENTIVLGGDNTGVRSELTKLGKKVLVRPLSEFQLAGGSAA